MIGIKSRIIRAVAGFPTHHHKPNPYAHAPSSELGRDSVEAVRKYGWELLDWMEPSTLKWTLGKVKKFDPDLYESLTSAKR